MKYRLSRLIPVRMRSTYGVIVPPTPTGELVTERATWWQWGNRIFGHRRTLV